jgi:hypothetical protein
MGAHAPTAPNASVSDIVVTVSKLVVLLTVFAGCSFSVTGETGGAGADASATDSSISPVDPDAGIRDAARAIDGKAVAPPPDACPDADNDGVCDDVDDWPCGAKPAAIAVPVKFVNGGNQSLTFSSVALAGGTNEYVVVSPGATITYGFGFDLQDMTCGGNCIDQIEIGLVANGVGNYQSCPVDQPISKSNGLTATESNKTLTAPMTGGDYDIRFDIGQNYSCGDNGHTNWWAGNPPPAAQSIAHVCVH